MVRGQRPKPLLLRVVSGSDPQGAVPAESPVATGGLVKPKTLKGREAKIWDETAPLLFWCAEADSVVLAVYCALVAEWEKDHRAITCSKLAQLRIYASELGMSCTARARINVNGKKKDPADAYLT